MAKGRLMLENRKQKLEKIFDGVTNSAKIHEAILLVEDTRADFSFSKGYGDKGLHSPLLMASITKLFTTACIFALQERHMLSLNDKVSKYFDSALLTGLHVYGGKDYSFDLTLSDLLFQITGLPDAYEEGKDGVKNRAVKEDFYFTFGEIVEQVKNLKTHFAPRTVRKAHYADINFDMLGEIIEKTSGSTLAGAYKRFIFEPLSLESTYLPESESDFIPAIYYRDKALNRPGVVMSTRASGGCITTARELMIFIKAFFGGRLFDKTIFERLSECNSLQLSMMPIRYGSGYMRIPMGGLSTLFMGKGELIGHSGSTGSFAFYYPAKDLFFVGDLNQMASPALPIRLSMKLAMMVK